MRSSLLLTLLRISCLLMVLVACQNENREQDPPLVLPPVPTPSPSPALTVVVEPTPAIVTLRLWGPTGFDPDREDPDARILREQQSEFEAAYPDIELLYEAKSLTGPSSLLSYLNAASAVAPAVLPDLIIIPVASLAEAAQTGLLFPLETLISDALQEELYPFATRDTRVEGQWLALPLAVQVEHGMTRSGRRSQIPLRLEEMASESAPIWLFAAHEAEGGEINKALFLQLLAISPERPGPGSVPSEANLVALFTALQAAQQAGTIPQQVLLLEENDDLVARLQQGEAELIQGDSRHYLSERSRGTNITFAPIPTLLGRPVAVVDGYLIALTTDDPRQQEAAARYLSWILASDHLAPWSRASHWLPARRTALEAAVDEASYRLFLEERLENGWLRPSGPTGNDFGQAIHEQFRALLLEQTSPARAAETIVDRYGP